MAKAASVRNNQEDWLDLTRSMTKASQGAGLALNEELPYSLFKD
jgi:hypothetical protein